jgi:hypothetical protein
MRGGMRKLATAFAVCAFCSIAGCGETSLCTFEEKGIAYCWESKKDVSWLTHCSREVSSDKECLEMGGRPSAYRADSEAYSYQGEAFSEPCTCHGAIGQCLESEAKNLNGACSDFYAYVN